MCGLLKCMMSSKPLHHDMTCELFYTILLAQGFSNLDSIGVFSWPFWLRQFVSNQLDLHEFADNVSSLIQEISRNSIKSSCLCAALRHIVTTTSPDILRRQFCLQCKGGKRCSQRKCIFVSNIVPSFCRQLTCHENLKVYLFFYNTKAAKQHWVKYKCIGNMWNEIHFISLHVSIAACHVAFFDFKFKPTSTIFFLYMHFASQL